MYDDCSLRIVQTSRRITLPLLSGRTIGVTRHEGRTALVTGAAQGLGLGIVRRLVSDGARVVALDVKGQTLRDACREFGDSVLPVAGDVADESVCADAVQAAVNHFGSIDLVAANAGIALARPFLEIDAEHWRRHQSINVDGAFWCLLHAARAMQGRPGSMVVTCSVNAFDVEETMTAYNVSKGALMTLVRSAAIDLGRHGIRVNGVAPGVIDTPITTMIVQNEELAPSYLKSIPLGRFGEPRDVADVVSWLLSDEARYVTGQTIVVDGGQTLGIPGELDTSFSEREPMEEPPVSPDPSES
jgi:NAD(P)-dependent dehydrogenase (short-subunit alcohol dehydrogenase family)